MRRLLVVVVVLSLLSAGTSYACVGKTLFVGVTHSESEVLFAEMISVLVNERTGTTVKILMYKDSSDLYSAVKKGDVGLFIGNTERALALMGRRQSGANSREVYEAIKSDYRKKLNLVWLEPFKGSPYAPVITVETLSNLPALPKLINKLSNICSEESYSRLMRSVKADEKPKKAARDFLKSKKLI